MRKTVNYVISMTSELSQLGGYRRPRSSPLSDFLNLLPRPQYPQTMMTKLQLMDGFQSPCYRNRLQNPQVRAGESQEGKCCTVKHMIWSFFLLPSSRLTQRAPSTAAAHLERFTHLARCPSWSESPCTASPCPRHHFPSAQFGSRRLVPPPQSIYTESLQ